MGLRKPKPAPTPISTQVPEMANVTKLPAFDKPKEAGGTGVPDSYKKAAAQGGNVMWRARLKGRTNLADDIPLHMSLKTFNNPQEVPHQEIADKVKELGIQRPDPSKLKAEATTFTSQRNGQTYYMLKLHGHDPSYDKFNEHFKDRGITYPSYMGHVTIDKELHDQIKKEGIQPHELEFSPLMIEHGSNNPTHLFPDNQSHNDHLSDITPKKLNPIENKTIDTGDVAIPSQEHKKLKASEDLFINMEKYEFLAKKCWEGYKRVPGTKAYSEGSCELKSKVKKNEIVKTLEKSTLKRFGTAAAIMGGLVGSPNVTASIPQDHVQQAPAFGDKMLHAISQVESSGGKNTNHAAIPGSMHHGEHAFGNYGLTPVVIRETLAMNPDLKRNHAKALSLHGEDMTHYLQDNPGLEQTIAQRHVKRLEHHFGQDPAKIGQAWLDGIVGTNKKIKQGMDPNKHWHAMKVVNAFKKVK